MKVPNERVSEIFQPRNSVEERSGDVVNTKVKK